MGPAPIRTIGACPIFRRTPTDASQQVLDQRRPGFIRDSLRRRIRTDFGPGRRSRRNLFVATGKGNSGQERDQDHRDCRHQTDANGVAHGGLPRGLRLRCLGTDRTISAARAPHFRVRRRLPQQLDAVWLVRALSRNGPWPGISGENERKPRRAPPRHSQENALFGQPFANLSLLATPSLWRDTSPLAFWSVHPVSGKELLTVASAARR